MLTLSTDAIAPLDSKKFIGIRLPWYYKTYEMWHGSEVKRQTLRMHTKQFIEFCK